MSGADDFDPLFTLDVVRDFMMAQGGKVSNHTLVTHFRTFLNDPVRKVANRQRFKQYVNTLSTVKLDPSGEKLLVIKKKYRDGVTDDQEKSATPSAVPAKENAQAKKDSKAKDGAEAKKDTKALAAATNQPELSQTPQSAEPSHVPPCLTDKPQDQTSKPELDATNADTSTKSPDNSGHETEAVGHTDMETTESDTGAGEFVSPSKAEESLNGSVVETASPGADSDDNQVTSPDSEVMPKPTVTDDESISEHAPTKKPRGSSSDDASEETSILSPSSEATPPSAVAMDTSEGVRDSADGSGRLMNVREKAQKIDSVVVQSKTDVTRHGAAAVPKSKRDRESRRNMEDGGGSEYEFGLSEVEREWMLKSVISDYHVMSKMLQSNAQLATKRDFVTGCTALHWAAKNGQSDVIKMLCGTYKAPPNVRSLGGYTPLHLAALHNHEGAVDLLVKTYRADPNIRDYSGRKAKQLLGGAASSHAHQTLQPAPQRRVGSGEEREGGGGLQRSGSYSDKIIKAGHFGLNPGVAVKNSWAGSQSGHSRSPSLSPASSRQPLVTSDDLGLMPPPRELPAVVRHKPTRSGSVRGAGGDQEASHSDSEAHQGEETGHGMHGSGSSPNVGTVV